MTNPWITHVKQYAAKNGLSYGCAMTDAGAKSSYKKTDKKVDTSKKVDTPKKVDTSKKVDTGDAFIEESIKDMFYAELPNFMKPRITREQVYKDKFLSRSASEQNKIRAMMKKKAGLKKKL
jgi:outer membrane translocation and assembly module TamA